MKSRLILLVFVFFKLNVFAQDIKNSQSGSEFSIYNYKPTSQDRLVLEVNHTNWKGLPQGIPAKITSGGINFQLFFDYPIKISRFSLAWGIGVSSHNIHGPIELVQQIDPLSGDVNYTSVEKRLLPYSRNRIGLKLLELPVEVRIRTKTNYQFKLMMGFKIGYVLQTFKKTFDKHSKVKQFDIYGINPLRFGPTLRVGWEQIHLTAFYSISEVFIKNKGTPGMHYFSIGFAYTPRLGIGR